VAQAGDAAGCVRVQVYWIVFSGLLVFEQFGLLPIFIGNVLYAGAQPSFPRRPQFLEPSLIRCHAAVQ
jgi:hypothetical protein